MTPPVKRDLRGIVFIILAALFLILPLAKNVHLERENPGLIAFNLHWDTTRKSLIATAEELPLLPDTVPAAIAPLFFQKIPVNRAGFQLLESVPGIGPELAGRIIRERDENGNFLAADDLIRVAGIGMKRKEHLIKYLRFD